VIKEMGSSAKTAAAICAVESVILLGAWLIPKATAKKVEPEPIENIASVIGQVRDEQLNSPIPSAKIIIDGITITADEGGYFGVDQIPLGKYTVKITAPGYRSKTVTWSLEEEKEYWIEIELTPIETLW
jgi:hypothetical protein